MPDKQRVSAADLVRNFGAWQEKALLGPVFVTHHKRDRLVLTSVENFTSNSDVQHKRTPAFFHNERSDISTEYALLADNISDAYLVLDEHLTIVMVNSRLEAMWRADRNQIIGRHFNDFIPEAKAKLLMEKIRRVMVSRQPEQIEFDSQVFPGIRLASKIYPHPKGVALLHTNVSELKQLRAESELIDSVKQAIDRHPQIACARTDARGKFTFSDDTLRLWTGFDEETLLSTRLVDICVSADRRQVNEAFDDVMTSHLPSALGVQLLGKSFSELGIYLTLAPVMSEHNAVGITIIATRQTTDEANTPLGEHR